MYLRRTRAIEIRPCAITPRSHDRMKEVLMLRPAKPSEMHPSIPFFSTYLRHVLEMWPLILLSTRASIVTCKSSWISRRPSDIAIPVSINSSRHCYLDEVGRNPSLSFVPVGQQSEAVYLRRSRRTKKALGLCLSAWFCVSLFHCSRRPWRKEGHNLVLSNLRVPTRKASKTTDIS